ncbi:helix-hairpin-helix domain-containing protein [Miniphocaeibacter halophilus]|uniref:Helix-hairpin-helix domain-containing protein n=1 Tax=Miniphocaeibacter halophilus TaxID=2931922 RepID=A0AC61MTE5_9FIRM|nr:helix-hairpin-helix domain-containing protein [Miniphocaeibacter halophilus]QQK07666.1 helix-hairpin-helix domain-containing protein [Miniphocaeibacter halophilus]
MKNINKDKIIIGFLVIIFAIYGFISSKKNSKVDFKEIKNDNIVMTDTTSKAEGIFVHVDGEVFNPGLYEFTNKDRVNDAISKAGGITDNADLKNINLAQKLEDEMKIFIPTKNTNENQVENNYKEKTEFQLININSASREELMLLPGIGETRADAILKYREENSFKKIEDLMNISGIGEKIFEGLKDLISVY